MLIDATIVRRSLKRKLAVIVLMTVSTIAAFATLGDGKDKGKNRSLLSIQRTNYIPGSFSLKSGYDFRGNHIISDEKSSYILLNTRLTYQKGNTTYILPIKRKVLLDKVKLNPASRGNY